MYSQVVNETLNPVWNQTFDFVVEDGLHDMLIVELWDHDTFGKVNAFSICLIDFVCYKICTLYQIECFVFYFFRKKWGK